MKNLRIQKNCCQQIEECSFKFFVKKEKKIVFIYNTLIERTKLIKQNIYFVVIYLNQFFFNNVRF